VIKNDTHHDVIVSLTSHDNSGRSWRILRPREFERKVIPAFFEHTKFSSFIRQANGWGFRRVIQGRDRGRWVKNGYSPSVLTCSTIVVYWYTIWFYFFSYYHEMFLRGMPHLCRKMKRPGKAMKITIDTDHEPDLYKISEMFPLPDENQQEQRNSVSSGPGGVPKEVVTPAAPQPTPLEPVVSLPTAGSAFVRPQPIPSAGPVASVPSPQPQISLVGGNASNELLLAVLRACQQQNTAQQPIPAPPLLAAPPAPGPSLVNMAREQRAKEILLGLLSNGVSQPSLPTSGLQLSSLISAPTTSYAAPNNNNNNSASDRAALILEALKLAASQQSFANQFRG
jgi:HSF-type DNA-binding